MWGENEPGMPFGRSKRGRDFPVIESQRGAGSGLAIAGCLGVEGREVEDGGVCQKQHNTCLGSLCSISALALGMSAFVKLALENIL